MTSKVRKSLIVTATASLIALSVAAFASCSGETDENTFLGVSNNKEIERVTYGSEAYRERLVTKAYRTTGEGVSVDGVIDDQAWTESYPLTYTYGGVASEVYTAFGEDGLYLATRMNMKAYYRLTRAADSNCGGNFFIAPSDAMSLNRNCIQIVYTARGYVMTSRGNKGAFETWYVNTYVKTYVDGGWVEEGDGSLRENGGLVSAGDYVSAEAFVPWEEIGLTEKPETVKIMPQLNYNSNSSYYRLFAGRPAGAYNNPRDWFLFDQNGYVHNDERLAKENPEAVIPVGHSMGNMSKTAAWDFSKIADGILTSGNMAQTQFIYFKDVYSENWMAEASVQYQSLTGGSSNTVGLCAEPLVTGATRTPITFNLPCNGSLAGTARWTAYTNTAQDHYGAQSIDSDVLTKTVNLKLIKMGSALFAFVDDTYFGSHQFDSLAGKAAPGIIAHGVKAQFSAMQVTTDTDEISAYLAGKNLKTVTLRSNEGGTLTLTSGNTTYGGNVALVEENGEVTLRVAPTVSQYSVYTLKSLKIGGVERAAELTNGELTFTVEGDTEIEAEFEYAANNAVLYGTVRFAGRDDFANAAVKFADADGRIVYAYTGIRQTEEGAVYVILVPDGTYRLWLDYKGNKFGECEIEVSDGAVRKAGEVTEKIDFLIGRPESLLREVIVWAGYPEVPLTESYFQAGETVVWSGEDSAIATFDQTNRTLTAVAAGTFTLTASTDGYSEIYNVTVKEVNKAGAQWQLVSEKTAYAEQLKAKWEKDGHDGKTTLFIGDSFFDVRNYWTDFYDTYAGKDALCAGIAGTTTYDWERYVETFLKETAPKNIVIHLGTNNFYDDDDSSETATENLQRLFLLIHSYLPDTNIYYFAISQRRDNSYAAGVSATNAAMQEWCEGYSWITFLDTEKSLTTDMLKDGVHPKLENYTVFTDALKNSKIGMETK